MSTIDPAKLKVVELRAELTSRGLDAKGNKPVLVKRLKEALEKELEKEIPDTSIADTSTEELNSSQESIPDDVQSDPPDKEPSVKVESPPAEPEPAKQETVEAKEPPKEPPAPVVTEEVSEEPQDESMAVEENGENVKQEIKEESEVKVEKVENIENEVNKVKEEEKVDSTETKPEEQPRGEKRRHSSPSVEKVQRKRSKSPVKEDEPVIDNNKVQLSWYDSDLHLLVDKDSFLSGKPYHEGAFGYAWAGARCTHGIKEGKICYEAKIKEELKWEELVKIPDKKKDKSESKESQKDKVKEEKEEKDETKPEEEDEAQNGEKEDKSEDGKESTEPESEEKPSCSTDETEKKEEQGEDEETLQEENEETVKEESEETMKEESEETAKKESEENTSSEQSDKPEPMEVDETPVEIPKHLFRIGWSVLDSGLQLGEAPHSYGYESSGKFVTDKQFTDYGVKFGVGDVVGAYVDITEDSVTFTYTVNGELLDDAKTFARSDFPQENFSLFPHVLTRNYSFELNLGSQEEPWFPHPAELTDYVFLEAVEEKVEGPKRPEARSECEVIMMCGLPASGKTHWVRELLKENAGKRYTVIGNTHLLEKMTVNGNPLKNSYKGRWNVILDRLMKCVNVLVEKAALRRRNYVIDQTNVFPSAQRRKMRLFEGFKRRAVVVVVGDEEQAKRRAQQEAQDGKDVPDSAILEMKANMSLPRRGEWLEEVTYIELGEEEAKALVQKYNQQGREAGFGPISGQRSSYRDNRGHPYRWDHSTSRRDYRGGYRDNRYQNNRFDRRQHGWQNRRPPPGSWNRDIRRDHRGPPGSRDFRNRSSSGSGGGGGGSSGGGGRPAERSSSRDNRNRNQSGNFNRNQRPQNNRNQPPSWQGSSWQGQNWAGNQNVWNQGWNNSQGSWGGQQPQQQWKGNYGQGGYGQGGYGNYPNWNYYGQYAQNWNSQGQPQSAAVGGAAASDGYGQYPQQAWAQYAQQQQYSQQGQQSTASTQPPPTQK